MDGAIIMGAGLNPEGVAAILRWDSFRHVASSMLSRGGRGHDFDGGTTRPVPENHTRVCEYVSVQCTLHEDCYKTF